MSKPEMAAAMVAVVWVLMIITFYVVACLRKDHLVWMAGNVLAAITLGTVGMMLKDSGYVWLSGGVFLLCGITAVMGLVAVAFLDHPQSALKGDPFWKWVVG